MFSFKFITIFFILVRLHEIDKVIQQGVVLLNFEKLQMTNLYTVKLNFISNRRFMNLIVDTGSQISWVQCIHSTCKNPKFTQIRPNENINYLDGRSISGYLIRDEIIFEKTKIVSMEIIQAVDSDFEINEIDGVLSLGYDSHSNRSVVDQLYRKGLINRKIFCFNFTEEIGEILIGDYFEIIKKNKSNLSSCNVIASTPYWECELSGIYFGFNFTYYSSVKTTSQNVIFDSGTNFIIVNSAYKQFFLKYFFGEYMNKQCFESEKYIYCDSLFQEYFFPDLLFEINGEIYKIVGSELFENLIVHLMFRVKFFSENSWILGEPFLKFFTLVFNYESKLIEFYGENHYTKKLYTNLTNFPDENFKNLKNSEFILITYICSFLCFILIMIVTLRLIKRERIRNNFY